MIYFKSMADRQNYSHRIMQRLGIDVDEYAILNIHQIGVNAPVSYVFQELLQWNGDANCWPNHIATIAGIDERLRGIKIFFLGFIKNPLQQWFQKRKFWGIKLFELNALKITQVPEQSEVDNARYMLFRCSGGYPIGIFAIYTRSAIVEQGEKEPTQLFMVVGFNFYGREKWSQKSIINSLWEKLHDRATANILNRLKQLCEWRFAKIQKK